MAISVILFVSFFLSLLLAYFSSIRYTYQNVVPPQDWHHLISTTAAKRRFSADDRLFILDSRAILAHRVVHKQSGDTTVFWWVHAYGAGLRQVFKWKINNHLLGETESNLTSQKDVKCDAGKENILKRRNDYVTRNARGKRTNVLTWMVLVGQQALAHTHTHHTRA